MHKAMTLLESLIALAVLGGTIILITSLLPQVFVLHKQKEDIDLLDDVVLTIAHQLECGQLGEGDGRLDPPLDHWRYCVDLEEIRGDGEQNWQKMLLRIENEDSKHAEEFVRIYQAP